MAVEFWNIPEGLIKAFYACAGLTVIIFILGFLDKARIWSKGMDVDQEVDTDSLLTGRRLPMRLKDKVAIVTGAAQGLGPPRGSGSPKLLRPANEDPADVVRRLEPRRRIDRHLWRGDRSLECEHGRGRSYVAGSSADRRIRPRIAL